METLLDVSKLDPSQLNLHKGEYGIYSIKWILELFEKTNDPNDEMISWLINGPPIYAAKEDDEMKKRMEAHAKTYIGNKDESIRITQLIKKEFYIFLCTDKKAYLKERSLLLDNINTLITGVATAIATNLKGIEIGIITTFVTFFVLLMCKMGKRVSCEYMKQTGI